MVQYRNMKRALPVLLSFALSGCVASALRGPSQDHWIQTEVIARSCEATGYGSPKCDEEDLKEMARQACLIAAIAHRKDGSQCGGK